MPKEEKTALLSTRIEITKLKNNIDTIFTPINSDLIDESKSLNSNEQKIKNCIDIIKKIQSDQLRSRKGYYGIALTLFLLGAVGMAWGVSQVSNHYDDTTNSFKNTLIPNTNSTCIDKYKINECDERNNSTVAICHRLQLDYCRSDPIAFIEIFVAAIAWTAALGLAIKKYKNTKDPIFSALSSVAKGEDKINFTKVSKTAEELNISVDLSLSQLLAAFEDRNRPAYQSDVSLVDNQSFRYT